MCVISCKVNNITSTKYKLLILLIIFYDKNVPGFALITVLQVEVTHYITGTWGSSGFFLCADISYVSIISPVFFTYFTIRIHVCYFCLYFSIISLVFQANYIIFNVMVLILVKITLSVVLDVYLFVCFYDDSYLQVMIQYVHNACIWLHPSGLFTWTWLVTGVMPVIGWPCTCTCF